MLGFDSFFMYLSQCLPKSLNAQKRQIIYPFRFLIFLSFGDISSTVGRIFYCLDYCCPGLRTAWWSVWDPLSFLVSVVSPVYWILMTSSFFIQCPFLPKYIHHENFLGKGAWAVKILRLYSSENIFILDWLVVWSLLKIIFPYNFKCHAPLSYSIHYSCENSDTVFLHGVCFYTLEAFSSFFSPLAPPTLHDDVWVFIHSCWWVLDLVESVNL